jgi:hypothetical protein
MKFLFQILFVVTITASALCQQSDIIRPRFSRPQPPEQVDRNAFGTQGDGGKAIPTWGAFFQYNGQFYGFDMIGTDPTLGSATSSLDMPVVPVALRFSDGTILDPTQPVQCNDTRSAVTLVMASPIFKNVDWAPGGTHVGKTQYTDAFQRAEWWNFANGSAPDYHVLLAPTVMPRVVVNVPANQGHIVKGGSCGVYGNVEGLFFDSLIRGLMVKLTLQPNQLPFFLTYDIVADNGILGYHSTFRNGTYTTATYNDQTFGPNHAFQDVVPISNVLGSAFNDPFGANLTPDWQSTYNPKSGCQFLLETGAPLAGRAIPARVPGNSHQYYVQDMAFELWFAKAPASTSVNGWFSMFNTLKTSAGNCQ